jgi:hypothetical protein
MTDWLMAIASLYSQRGRELLTAVGHGFDPIPRLYHKTFCDTDHNAAVADWEALYLDWWRVHCKLVEHHTRTLMEAQHHRGTASRATTSRAIEHREREIA